MKKGRGKSKNKIYGVAMPQFRAQLDRGGLSGENLKGTVQDGF
jgi:hypothetical protein